MYGSDSDLSVMEDAVITNLFVAPGEHALYFVARDGRIFAWLVDGDCCSCSWFADVIGVSSLLNRRIIEAVIDEMPEGYNIDDGRCRQEVDSCYGYKLKTDGGYVDIVYRNSSNGYYGGWMNMSIISELPEGLVEIFDEWQAT